MQILLPVDSAHAHQIVLATNFGLIISEDDGATWYWTCEPNRGDNAFLYQMGPAPRNRIFAVLLSSGLSYSDDLACSWSPSGGSLATAVASDAFPDPSDPSRVFAVAAERGDAPTPAAVYRSDDGGLTFGPPLYTAPRAGGMLGVESAFSDPATVYLAAYATTGTSPVMLDPMLISSTDGGGHWAGSDLASSLGFHAFRLIAVDRADPRRLFLRVTEPLAEKLAVSIDGGLSFQEPVAVDDKLTAFVRLASGTVLVGGSSSGGPVGFRSIDGGMTFQPWPNPPHLRALAERAGKLYAAADNFLDGFAVGVSTDEGLTFQPLLSYDQVRGVKPCVRQACQEMCENLAGLMLWPMDVCSAVAPDAGTHPPAPRPAGCGCGVAGAEDAGAELAGKPGRSTAGSTAGATLALAVLLVARRSRRRPGAREGLKTAA